MQPRGLGGQGREAQALPERRRVLHGNQPHAGQPQQDGPLLHLHLQKLEDAGLVSSKLELSPDGKALNFFEATPFVLNLTPSAIAQAASTLSKQQDQ